MALDEQFHAIDGETVGERRKKLNHLIQNWGKDDDVTGLTPCNHLEELFKVDALILLKKDAELLNVLQGDNYILIHKVLKQGFAIVKPRILTLNAEQFVHDLLPSLAFSTKIKLLNKLAVGEIRDRELTTERADEWFYAVKNEYGLHLALKLLPCCSTQVILDAVKWSRFYLDSRQLLAVIKKHPTITVDLINALVERRQGRFNIHESVIKHIIHVNVDLYLELAAKHEFNITLSKRGTKRFIRAKTNAVIGDLPKYKTMLHFGQAQKILKADLQGYFMDTLRDSADEFVVNSIAFELKKVRMRKYRWPFFVNCFKQKYGFDIFDEPKLVSVAVLKLMPKKERLEYVAKSSRPPSIPEEGWMVCHDVHESIPYLKYKIKLTSNKRERMRLLEHLVETCFVNDDETALAQVCEYFLQFHQNESCSARQAFLTSIHELFNMVKFAPELWALIIQIIELFLIRDEHAWISHYAELYIKHLIARGERVEDGLTLYGKCADIWWGNLADNKENGRMLIEALIKMLPTTTCKTEEVFDRHMYGCVEAVELWNQQHPKQRIALLQHSAFFQHLQKLLVKEPIVASSYRKYTDLVHVLQREGVTKECLEIWELIFTERHINELRLEDYVWLLKRRPSIVQANLPLILPYIFNENWLRRDKASWKFFRSFSHLNIPQDMNAFIRSKLNADQIVIDNYFIAAAILMPVEEFHALASAYLPEPGAEMTKIERSLFQRQQALAQALLYVGEPITVTDIIVKFFIKDYMPRVLKSLQATACKLKENQLDVLLLPLRKEQAVSLNKHVIYLCNNLKNLQLTREYLQKAVEKEQNLSIRKVLARTLFNNFSANCDRFSWDLFKKIFQAVDVKDIEALRDILRIQRVPDEYLVEYIHFTWQHIGRFELPEEKINEMRAQFLKSLSPQIIAQLSTDFLLSIIRPYLFQTNKMDGFEREVQAFACRSLCNTTAQAQEQIFKEIVSLAQNYLTMYWNSTEIKNCASTFSNFITICLEQSKKALFQRLKIAFMQILNPIEAFNECLLLEFGLISYSESLAEIAQKLVPLFNDINGNLCNLMFDALKEFLDKYAKKGPKNKLNENTYVLIHQIVTASSSVNCLIMACLMMNFQTAATPKAKTLYQEIVSILKSSRSDVVKTYLFHHIKQ